MVIETERKQDMGVSSFVNNISGSSGQARSYDHMKRMSLIQGLAAQKAAYSQAGAVERAAKKNAQLDAEAMATMQGNKRRAEGAARAMAGASGAMSSGSGRSLEQSVSKNYEKSIANAAVSSSIEQENALNSAIGLRKQGDDSRRAAEAEAAQYRAAARGTRTGMWFSAAGGILGMALAGYEGKKTADEYNGKKLSEDATPEERAELERKQSWFHNASTAGSTYVNSYMSAANAFNPYMSRWVTPGWESGLIRSYMIGNRNLRGSKYQNI